MVKVIKIAGIVVLFLWMGIGADTYPETTGYISKTCDYETYHLKKGKHYHRHWKKKDLVYITLKCSENGLVLPPESFEKKVDLVVSQIRFSSDRNFTIDSVIWDDSPSDGTFDLKILPNFLFLSTGHNNPNPNRFIWHTELTNPQYQSIQSYLRTHRDDKKHFNVVVPGKDIKERYFYWEPHYPESKLELAEVDKMSQAEQQKYWKKEFSQEKSYAYNNLIYLIHQFNKGLPSGEKAIPDPDFAEFDEHSVLLISSFNDLE